MRIALDCTWARCGDDLMEPFEKRNLSREGAGAAPRLEWSGHRWRRKATRRIDQAGPFVFLNLCWLLDALHVVTPLAHHPDDYNRLDNATTEAVNDRWLPRRLRPIVLQCTGIPQRPHQPHNTYFSHSIRSNGLGRRGLGHRHAYRSGLLLVVAGQLLVAAGQLHRRGGGHRHRDHHGGRHRAGRPVDGALARLSCFGARFGDWGWGLKAVRGGGWMMGLARMRHPPQSSVVVRQTAT